MRMWSWRPSTVAAPMVVIAASLWLAGPANFPLWQAYAALPEVHGLGGLVGGVLLWALLTAVFTALLLPFSWRHLLKPVLALMFFASALCAHFISSYGIVIDPGMMTNALQTDPAEVRDLLGFDLVWRVLLLGVMPTAMLYGQRIRWGGPARQAVHIGAAWSAALALIVGLALLQMADLSNLSRNHKAMRYRISPLNALWSTGTVTYAGTRTPGGPPAPIGLDARVLPAPAGVKPPLVVLVVGETARAGHFALNGYARATNPELSKLDGVLSFHDVTSCGTSTAASLPCMFSSLGRDAYERSDGHRENLLDLLQRAGLAVLWIDNQSGCKGQCDRVPHAAAYQPAAGAAPMPDGLCEGHECFDEAMLHGLDERLAALPAEARQRGIVVVLHQMGSHGPAYYLRSPPGFKPFKPECEQVVLAQCDHDGLVNAYDNSIVYTDHFLARTVTWLQRHADRNEPSMVYVSDHGESLGEGNLYLHGMPYSMAPRVQVHVPMIAWTGGATGSHDLACLRSRLDAPLTHDHLFHTVMGLARVRSSEYRADEDAFAACSRAGAPSA